MNEEAALLEWFPLPRAVLVDMSRVNIDDWLHAWKHPGTIVRVTEMDGLPVVPISEGAMKLYPIEDEL